MKSTANFKTFPRITSAESLVKQPIKNFNIKIPDLSKQKLNELKIALSKRDIILNENMTNAAINVKCFATNGIWDKIRTINLVRLASHITPNISFYGWNGLAIELNLLYGSKKCTDTLETITRFAINHANAYRQEIKKSKKINITPIPDSIASLRADSIFCKDNTGESCYARMWYYSNNYYYIYDELISALLSYGYTKEQLRSLIHLCNTSNTLSGIPEFIRNKFFSNPDGSKSIRDMLERINNAK